MYIIHLHIYTCIYVTRTSLIDIAGRHAGVLVGSIPTPIWCSCAVRFSFVVGGGVKKDTSGIFIPLPLMASGRAIK